tara:strand:- start:21 stop:446 length:426 start_codon:yes stop_codon:yes gene_type:complete
MQLDWNNIPQIEEKTHEEIRSMLTEKFEIVLAPTCTEKEAGLLEVWATVTAEDGLTFTPSHCIITTQERDHLTGKVSVRKDRLRYGLGTVMDPIIMNLCESHFTVKHMTELYLHRDEFAHARNQHARELTTVITQYREAAL